MDHGLHPRRPLGDAHEQLNGTVKGQLSRQSQPQKAGARKREVGTEAHGSPAVLVFNVLPLDSERSLACLYCVTHSTVTLRTCPSKRIPVRLSQGRALEGQCGGRRSPACSSVDSGPPRHMSTPLVAGQVFFSSTLGTGGGLPFAQ